MVKTTPFPPSLRSVCRASLAEGHRFSIGRLYVAADASPSQVLPTGPTLKRQDSATKRRLRDTRNGNLSFSDAFGYLGIPMVLNLVLCLVWTAWLVFVSLAPNEAANWLMNTSEYDSGQFWLIIDTDQVLTMVGVGSLVVVGLSYLFVTLKMLLWREKNFSSACFRRLEGRLLGSWKASRLESRTWYNVVGPTYTRMHAGWKELTSFNGKKRKLWTIVLFQLLKRGSPIELVYGYAFFVAANSLSCATNILFDRFSVLTEVLIDSIFDFAAAVLFPIATLMFCYYNFEFEREVYHTYMEKLVPGSFEHIARLFADQAEVALFRVSFDSLRFSSSLALVVRIAMNLAFCYRAMRMMEVIIWRRRHAWISGRTLRKSSGSIIPLEHKKAVPKLIAFVFVFLSIAVIVVTHQSISHSVAACSAYPACVVKAYRWSSSKGPCPCLIFIDVDKSPKTYEEWAYPPDAHDALNAVSVSGMLESIQIINRQLLELPGSLQSCRNLKSIQLMYTSIQDLPSWAGDFSNLETFHLEGKLGAFNLRELPDNLFSNMPRLALIHLGVHENIKKIPRLVGVPHLQSLTLAWMFHLHHLPALDLVPDLTRLVISVLPFLEWVPDMTPLRKLVDFTIMPGVICCNGFINACNLGDFLCQGSPIFGIPPATCLVNDTDWNLPVTPFLGSAETREAFKKFAPGICSRWAPGAIYIDNTPTKEKIEMCAGKPFRECHLPGNVTGICYNLRFQVLSCINDDTRITLRRYQIEKGVGAACDPIEEKWLGCE